MDAAWPATPPYHPARAIEVHSCAAALQAMEVNNEQALDSKRVDHGRGHCWICSRSIVTRSAG
jgi:hypothetical protein